MTLLTADRPLTVPIRDLQCWGKAGAGLTWTPRCDPEEQQWVGLQREHAHIPDHRSHLQQWWTGREAPEDSVKGRQCMRQKIPRETSVSPCLYQHLSLHTEIPPLAGQQWKPFSRFRRSESTVTVLQNPLDKGVPGILVCSVLWPYRGSVVLIYWDAPTVQEQHCHMLANPYFSIKLEHLSFIPLVKSSKWEQNRWKLCEEFSRCEKSPIKQHCCNPQARIYRLGKAPTAAAAVEGSWEDWMEKDQRDAVGWQCMFQKTKCHWAASGRIKKVTSLEEIQGADLPSFGLPMSRRGIVHRRQKIDL